MALNLLTSVLSEEVSRLMATQLATQIVITQVHCVDNLITLHIEFHHLNRLLIMNAS